MTQEHKTNTQVEKPPKKISVVISFGLSLQDSRTVDLEPMAYLTPDLVEKALSIAASFKDGGAVKRFATGGDTRDTGGYGFGFGVGDQETTSNTAANEDIVTPSATTSNTAASEDANANPIQEELDSQGQGESSNNFGFNLYSDTGLEQAKNEPESQPYRSSGSSDVARKLDALNKAIDQRGQKNQSKNILDSLLTESIEDSNNPIDFYNQNTVAAPGATSASAPAVIPGGILGGKSAAIEAEKKFLSEDGDADDITTPVTSGLGSIFDGVSKGYELYTENALKGFSKEGMKELADDFLAGKEGMLSSSQVAGEVKDSSGKSLGVVVTEKIEGKDRIVGVYPNSPESKETPEMAAQYKSLFETQDVQNRLDARGEGKDEREAQGLASLAAEAEKPVVPIKPKTIQIPRFTARDFAAFSPTGVYSNAGIPGVLGETR